MLNEFHSTTCKPLECLDDVLGWRAENVKRPYRVRGLARSDFDRKPGDVKIMLCHDMKNNYLEDKHFQGALLQHDQVAYRFYNWSLIESFIYFSHHFITIPTESWINAAHVNGVPVFATLITENVQGFDLCERLLSDRTLMETFVKKLVGMTVFYGFDGWLLNFENEIRYENVDNLLEFVKLLVKSLRDVDASRYKVVWYDSVIGTGKLKWQNELNGLNECFFDEVDAMFLNYTWNRANLVNSYLNAKHRTDDVYVGVDVFGRNCFGGGGFCCDQAFHEISKAKLNVALFAPGWVLEVNEEKAFEKNERRFWACLEPYAAKRRSTHLPLLSTFNQGCGEVFFVNGVLMGEKTNWYNLNIQTLQPGTQMKWCFDDAFYGGSCVQVNSTCTKLFDFNATLEKDSVVSVKYAFKMGVTEDEALNVYLCLAFSKVPQELEALKLLESTVCSDFELENYKQSWTSSNWIVREFQFRAVNRVSLSQLTLVNNSPYSDNVKVGFVSIIPQTSDAPCQKTDVISDVNIKQSTCFRLENRHMYCFQIEWKLNEDVQQDFGYYNLFLKNDSSSSPYSYIGSTTVTSYCLCLELENYQFNYSKNSDNNREENKKSQLLVQHINNQNNETASKTIDIEIPARANVKRVLHDFEFVF